VRRGILEFVERLQRASAPEEFVNLHRDVLIEFGARQSAAGDVLPQARSEARATIAELARQNPKPLDQIREQQELLERVTRQERIADAMQHTLRQIGDGIAWRALRYDRRAITVLGAGERVGRLAEGIGLDAELAQLGDLWEKEQVFAIHNDLTNCLRHGDLTAIRPGESNLDVTVIEVKASKRRDDTQLQRLATAIETLADDRRFDYVPVRYRTFLANVPALIATAKRRGHAWTRPAPYLVVSAVDYRVCAGRENELLTPRIAEMRERVGWFDGGLATLDWTASLRRMRDRRDSFSSLAPLTIFPLPPDDVTDLVMGFVDLSVNLNLEMLERTLGRGGLAVRVARPPESERLFLEASRGPNGVLVPPHVREQMMTELTTPYTVRRAIEAVLNRQLAAPETAGDSRLVVFADEERVWERR